MTTFVPPPVNEQWGCLDAQEFGIKTPYSRQGGGKKKKNDHERKEKKPRMGIKTHSVCVFFFSFYENLNHIGVSPSVSAPHQNLYAASVGEITSVSKTPFMFWLIKAADIMRTRSVK